MARSLVRHPARGSSAVDSEWAKLERREAGTIQRFRLEALGSRLGRAGPLRVIAARNGLCGDRLRLLLEDATQVRAKLFWPVRTTIEELLAVRWIDEVGWSFEVRLADGSRRRLWAYFAQLDLGPSTR